MVSSRLVLAASGGLLLCLLLAGCGGGEEAPPAEPKEEVAEPSSGVPKEETAEESYLRAFALIRQGQELEAEARWEEAITNYQAAEALIPGAAEGEEAEIINFRNKRKWVQDRVPYLQEKISSKGALPDLAPPADGNPQTWYLAIQQAMGEARDLDFDGEDEMAIRHYRACVVALDQLPEGFNVDIVASRRRNIVVEMAKLKTAVKAALKAEKTAKLEKQLGVEPEKEASAEGQEIPSLMSGMTAPMEGEQALFLDTINQVRTARRLQEQGRLKPALYEYEEALKKMKKMNPKLKHGDGGPDDEVRDSIRTIKRQLKN